MADQEDKLQIRLHVYDTDMGVTIQRSEEEYYRKAAKLITDTVNTYASLFQKKRSEKDILYMAMIDIALRYEQQAGRNDTRPYSDLMTKLTKEIESAMKV